MNTRAKIYVAAVIVAGAGATLAGLWLIPKQPRLDWAHAILLVSLALFAGSSSSFALFAQPARPRAA